MENLFLKILNMSIAASYLVIAVVLLRLMLKKAPRWTFVLLWGIVALRLLCPFSIESVMSLIPSAEPIPDSVLSAPSYDVPPGLPSVDGPVQDDLYLPDHGQNAVTPPKQESPTVMSVLTTLWLAGMVLMAAYTAFSYWYLHRKVATAVRFRDRIYTSEHVASPFILGLFRPRIYLPCGLCEGELGHILAHEQAHIRRKDHWWKPLGFLLLTVHWFNPLMWVAYALLSRDIEQACDEKVIRNLEVDQRADYSQTLLKCSISRRSIAACPLAFGEVGVKERVKNVLKYKRPAFWIILTAVAACIVVALCFLTDPITPANAEIPETYPAGNQPPQSVPGPVDAWYGIRGHYNSERGSFQLNAFPGVTFRWDGGKLEAVTESQTIVIMDTPYIQHIAAADLNMDGYPEICVTADWSTEEHSCYVIVYDYFAKKSYSFPSEDDTGYFLYRNSNYLMCARESLERDETETAGRLMLTGSDADAKLTILAPPQPIISDTKATLIYDKYSPDSSIRGQFTLDAFPDVTFSWYYSPGVINSSEQLIAVKDGIETTIIPYGNATSMYICDVTSDGKPDFCANVYFFFSGLPSFNAVYVYDYAHDVYYMMADDVNTGHYMKVSYYLRLEGGKLVCDKVHEATSQVLSTGILVLGDAEFGKQLYLVPQVTYDSPVYYQFAGDSIWENVKLTVCADGRCNIKFNTRLNDDGTANWAQGTYTKADGKLIMHTEDGEIYTFRFEGDDLVFLEKESYALPSNCALYDGAVLEASPAYP